MPVVFYAQRNCGITELEGYSQPDTFENWLDSKIQSKRQSRGDDVLYHIPVVVHIIHKGESIGIGSNISEEQVLSQIRILNEDFRRKEGTNGFNDDPRGADINIEFVLALTDPNGNPTNGIVRIQNEKEDWNISEENSLKSLSYWNAESYLNIWVCNLTGFLGYATFPESDLPGLEETAQDPTLDGVVIDYQVFGDVGNLHATFNLGRTATHEIGHYLGLRHIWGDVSFCNGTDYCEDTPPAFNANRGCMTEGRTQCDPHLPEMFNNYMDYTDDACMNIFTQDQKTRMRTVLENSPRRKSLISSPALNPPIVADDDAGIESILSPQFSICSNEIFPVIVIRNYGKNNLTNVQLTYQINDLDPQVYNWVGNLSTHERDTIYLEKIILAPANYNFKVSVNQPNQRTDGFHLNDEKYSSFLIQNLQNLPLISTWTDSRSFDNAGWEILNFDNDLTWTFFEENLSSTPILQLPSFDYPQRGEEDWLISPILDLTLISEATISFDVSYAPYSSDSTQIQETLRVLLSDDCGQTFSTLLYEKSGLDLATSPANQEEWIPTSGNHWRRETIDLSPFAYQSNIQLAFVVVSNFGNNLYLRQIAVQEPPKNKIFTIYPNPNQGNFALSFNLPQQDPITVTLLSIQGQVLFRAEYDMNDRNQVLVNIPQNLSGIFLLNVKGKNIENTQKVLFDNP